jgi:RNA recognition motif-containing protein
MDSIKCRKCGGPHLTIKCGKNDIEVKETFKKEYSRKSYKVKIANLPSDMTQDELSSLLKDWGHINRVSVKNYPDSSYSIIEFKFEDEVDYFIEALNSTPFDKQIINVTKLE